MSSFPRILVTPRSLSREGVSAAWLEPLREAGFQVHMPTPGRQPTEEELLKYLPGCIAYLAGVERISRLVLEAASPALKVISRNGTGVDSIDLAAAKRLGIPVKRAKGANSRGVAELTLGLILGAARSIPQSHKQLKQGAWARSKGIELQHRILGIIGCGHIGRIVARLGGALGMRVLGYDPYPDVSLDSHDFFSYASLTETLNAAHVVTLHCPPVDGKPIIDAETLEQVRDGAFLINTARAALVDSGALLRHLEAGHVAGYATDVFHREPPEIDELLAHERVILTPHLGGYTEEGVERATAAAVRSILETTG